MTTNHNRNAYRATSNWTGRVDRRSRLPGDFRDDLGAARGLINSIALSLFAWALLIFVGWAAWTMF